MAQAILLVEDNEMVLNLARRCLDQDDRLAAVECVACATYAAAIAAYEELIGRDTPTGVVLVTDFDLDADHTGAEVIEELVRQGFTGPALIVSGRLEDRERKVAGLTVKVMAKPYPTAVLCDAVAALLAQLPEVE